MFKVSSSKFDLSVAFIASPFQPAEDGAGVCTSGIANAAASKILRTVFHAGLFPLTMTLPVLT
jgi:hypothetical protein